MWGGRPRLRRVPQTRLFPNRLRWVSTVRGSPWTRSFARRIEDFNPGYRPTRAPAAGPGTASITRKPARSCGSLGSTMTSSTGGRFEATVGQDGRGATERLATRTSGRRSRGVRARPSNPQKICAPPPPVPPSRATRSLCPPETLARRARSSRLNRAPSGFRCRRYCRTPPPYVPPTRSGYRGQTSNRRAFRREAECRWIPTPRLHLVAAHILVVEVLQPTAEFLLVFLVGNRGGQLGGFEHGVVDEDGAIQAQG
jgi:hypothetical protein